MGGSQPYVGMIIIVPYNFAPAGWSFCAGQLVPISENETLFNLIGTNFGGDGQQTFALPNLQSRVAPHTGGGLTFAETGGVESVTLTTNQIPAHTHAAVVSSGTQNSAIPNGSVLAKGPQTYTNTNPQTATLAQTTLSSVGGSQPHSNIKPYLCLNFIISQFGIFPTQT
jgi:microcystin-dependent protein